MPRGILLSGPPGCGKTAFASALAASCKVPLIHGSYAAWHATGSGHQGDFLIAMSRAFAEAVSRAPPVLFIDEVDSFPNRETLTHRQREYSIQVVNALLAEIDGVAGREGVVILAACNHPGMLDPALVRSGRLERHIRIGRLDRPARARILRDCLGAELPDLGLEPVLIKTEGATGADVVRLVRDARGRARAAGRSLDAADLVAAPTETRSERHLRTVAVHEAGHAVAACVLRPGSVRAVSIRAAGEASGRLVGEIGRDCLIAADIADILVILLAGRAAELELLGVASVGAGGSDTSDLAHATLLATNSIVSLGLDPGGSLVWRGHQTTSSVTSVLAYSPAIEAQVRDMLDHALAAARNLVRQYLGAVERLSGLLLREGSVDGEMAQRLLGEN